MAEFSRTWTTVGEDAYEFELEDGTVLDQAVVAAAIDALEWQDVPKRGKTRLAAMPALGITAAIEELRIPKVSKFSISTDLAPYGLYGIEGNYSNGRARIYVLDRGSDLLPMASDFWPAELPLDL